MQKDTIQTASTVKKLQYEVKTIEKGIKLKIGLDPDGFSKSMHLRNTRVIVFLGTTFSND